MRLRILAVAIASVLAVAGLAGCRTNAGTAASVNGTRITESDVNKYLTATGVDAQTQAQAQAAGQAIPAPRTQVLQSLILEQLFEKTVRAESPDHALPTDTQLDELHDAAASLLLQTQLTGGALDNALRVGLPKSGVKASFANVFLRVQELEYLLIKGANLSQLPDLVALIKKTKPTLSVSARYGTWNFATLTLSSGTNVPSYLTVKSSAAATPAG